MSDTTPELLPPVVEALAQSDFDEPGLLAELVRVTVLLLDAERCSLFLFDNNTYELVLAASHGLPAEAARMRVRPDDGIMGAAFITAEEELGHVQRKGGITSRGCYRSGSWIAIPLKGKSSTPYGVICATDLADGRDLVPGDLHLIAMLVGVVASRLDSRREGGVQLVNHPLPSVDATAMVVDRDGVVLAAGERALRMLEAHEPLVGRNLCESCESDVAHHLLGVLTYARVRGERAVREIVILPPGASDPRFVLRIAAAPLADTGNLLLTVEDIRTVHEMEELGRLEDMKSSFINLVSHELRTPLTSLRGAASLLGSFYSSALDETQANLLRIMTQNIERLTSVVNSIIDVGLIEQNQLEVTPTPGDLGDLLDGLIEARQTDLQAKNLVCERRFEPDAVRAHFDGDRLLQAIASVFDNAVKHTQAGGTIELSLRRDETGYVRLQVRNPGHLHRGDHRERVFEKFFQIEQIMTRKQGGIGLGLYIARQIAVLHGGNLAVVDDPTHVVFEFRLPGE